MKKNHLKTQYVICIRNEGSEDFVPGKVYQVSEDQIAARAEYIRVIDDSSEDYLYPASYFVAIALPQAAQQALFTAASSSSSISAA